MWSSVVNSLNSLAVSTPLLWLKRSICRCCQALPRGRVTAAVVMSEDERLRCPVVRNVRNVVLHCANLRRTVGFDSNTPSLDEKRGSEHGIPPVIMP